VGYKAQAIVEHLHGVGLGRPFCDMYLERDSEMELPSHVWCEGRILATTSDAYAYMQHVDS
jgi:hypothetical protein